MAIGLGLSSEQRHLVDAMKPTLLAMRLVRRRGRAACRLSAACATGAGRWWRPRWWRAVVAADLGVNNGPNESTALPPELYDVLRHDTKNETIGLLKRLTAQPSGSPRRDRVELLGLGFEWPNAGMVHGFDHTLGYNPLRLADFSDAVGTRDTIAGPDQRKFTPLFPSYRCAHRRSSRPALHRLAGPDRAGRQAASRGRSDARRPHQAGLCL